MYYPTYGHNGLSGYHGSDGPWKITKVGVSPVLQDIYLNASQELGLKVLPDSNSAEQEGNPFIPQSHTFHFSKVLL